jgi:Na+-translocating ferredoxin:NAD+ oxidoreductase RnfC subunit
VSNVVGDCASDPPLGATARKLACGFADEVIYGLGLVAIARDGAATKSELAVWVRHDDAEAALRAAIARVGANVEVVRVADAWPASMVSGPPGAGCLKVDAVVLVAAADAARGRAERRFVTVAGAVAAPAVLETTPEVRVDELVARAGGATDDAWVAVAGGAPAGRLVDRDACAAEVGSLVLVLPTGHPVVQRLRMSTGEWLQRAASACEGCRLCSDACPAGVRPHDVIWTLVSGRDDGVDLQQTAACTGCAICDVHCPAGLAPARLVGEVRDRMGLPAPPAIARRSGLDVDLLTLRLGLAPYTRLFAG